MATPGFHRDDCLRLGDGALLDQCEVDTYRASGPGGQKRNKTSSAVRLRHRPSGVLAIAEESRSQHENKQKALRRLRMLIALEIRQAPSPGTLPDEFIRHRQPAGSLLISTRHADYPLIAATALDVLSEMSGRLADAASRLGISTGQLSKFLSSDGRLLAAANGIRKANSLKPLICS
jgi:hypothetical protein